MKWTAAIIACFLLTGLFACQQKTELVIGKEEMVNILIDIHLAEAAVHNLYGAVKDSTIVKYYDQVYQIHGISREEFDQAMDQLKDNPEILYEIYAEVLDQVKLKESSTE